MASRLINLVKLIAVENVSTETEPMRPLFSTLLDQGKTLYVFVCMLL